ncbi:hypothetical protein B0H13DRAFT_2311767 [Mycena leptocephala]|nr:hypothetical protein B0H13DRAFT_2311767 [Mycena leptocephala]
MALDLSNPRERQLAMDRLAVGVGPTLGQHATAAMKKIRKARVVASRRATSCCHSIHGHYLFDESRAPPKQRTPVKIPRSLHDEDDAETLAMAEQMLESFKAGLGDPFDLWQNPPAINSNSDDDDEWDPKSGLAYCPRLRINTRVANALTMIATTLGQLEADQYAEERRIRAERYVPWPHMRLAMQAVAAQIVTVCAEKRSLERDEISPAPHGFCYIQVKDQVYLASENDEGSLVYVAEADRVLVLSRN